MRKSVPVALTDFSRHQMSIDSFCHNAKFSANEKAITKLHAPIWPYL